MEISQQQQSTPVKFLSLVDKMQTSGTHVFQPIPAICHKHSASKSENENVQLLIWKRGRGNKSSWCVECFSKSSESHLVWVWVRGTAKWSSKSSPQWSCHSSAGEYWWGPCHWQPASFGSWALLTCQRPLKPIKWSFSFLYQNKTEGSVQNQLSFRRTSVWMVGMMLWKMRRLVGSCSSFDKTSSMKYSPLIGLAPLKRKFLTSTSAPRDSIGIWEKDEESNWSEISKQREANLLKLLCTMLECLWAPVPLFLVKVLWESGPGCRRYVRGSSGQSPVFGT